MIPYNYICIEGNIGAGKTTFATKLAAQLNARLILEQFADNPFLPKFYTNPDKYAFPLELSFMAERYRQLKLEVESQNLFQPFTISDYVFYKCLIFASVNLQVDEVKLYKSLFNIIYQNLPTPEIILFFNCPTDKLLLNIKNRGRDYEQDISADYLNAVNEMYFEFFKHQDKSIVLVLDTTQIDFVNNESTYLKICKLLEKKYDTGLHFVQIDS
ncbi:MAG: deoxynucleoside kinase [Bacteroidota bacterium]